MKNSKKYRDDRYGDYDEYEQDCDEEYEEDEYVSPTFGVAVRRFASFIFKSILILMLVAALALWGLYSYIFADYKTESFTADREALGISAYAPDGELYHVAVFGIDVTDGVGRSDCTMILTVDTKNKQLKVSSLLRDSYVPIKGHGNDKLNHAYAYGGAELMLHTINTDFDMDISEYVVLDFDDVSMLVDAIGGLDLEISDAERKEINRLTFDTHAPLSAAGTVHLDGAQITAYGRIRYIDNEIYRTGRQRKVLQAALDKLQQTNYLKYPSLMHDFLPMLETSLEKDELSALVLRALLCDWSIKEYVLPADADEPVGGSYAGYWCWRFDIDRAAANWHVFLEEKQ